MDVVNLLIRKAGHEEDGAHRGHGLGDVSGVAMLSSPHYS
jgi:hypothetical protein